MFITPGYRFRAVDVMMTNFHLPRSTLFMLVAAFSGLEVIKRAYAHAGIAAGYRFYSYGDACLLFERRADTTSDMAARPFAFIASDERPARRDHHPARWVATPAFSPGGTQATVKGLAPDAVRAAGTDILLANTYHLTLRPGAERIAALGGLHAFMNGRTRS